VDFFLGPTFLVTVAAHGRDPGAHNKLEEAIRVEQASIGKGPDYLLHVILDHIVDDKLLAIEALQDDLDAAEEKALKKGPAAFNPADLLHLRRNLLALRKSLFHEREILVKICRRDSPFISEAAIYHFRDIYDHLVKFVEVIEICREMIATLIEIHLSLVNNELARLEQDQPGGPASDLHHHDSCPLAFRRRAACRRSMMIAPELAHRLSRVVGFMAVVGLFSYSL
jgi:magnesium transporter